MQECPEPYAGRRPTVISHEIRFNVHALATVAKAALSKRLLSSMQDAKGDSGAGVWPFSQQKESSYAEK